ncbi:MAG TPA: thioredoxin, partial [Methanocella sp.]|nr:thioredoxin [Methanocella sp.]
MTANQVSTALLVLAVLAASFAAGIALTHSAARPVVAQVTGTQYSAASPADIDSALASGPVFVEFETK